MALKWQKVGTSWEGMSGDIIVGSVGQLSADPSTWWYTVDAVYVKWIAKGRGHVKSCATAKRAVERAWQTWLERAKLVAMDDINPPA